MKQFAITFLAVLAAVATALFAYDYFIVKPRTAAQAEAIQVDLGNAKTQAEDIARNLDSAVNKSISTANDSMNAQVGEMQQRALAADAITRGSMFKAALTEYYMSNGKWPKNHEESGMAKPESYAGGAVSSISVGEKGSVIIALNDKFETGAKIRLIPDVNEQSYMVNWRCVTEGSETLKRSLSACNQ